MKTDAAIKLRGGFSHRSLFLLFFTGFGVTWVLAMLGMILDLPDSLMLLFIGPFFLWLIAMSLLPFTGAVYLEQEQIRVVRFGRMIQNLPVSQIRFICVTGNSNESILCLSGYTVEELAQFQEEKLKKGILTRDEIPFRKRYGNWQDRFANEYLNRLCWRMLWSSPDERLLWISMDQISVAAVRCLYPQIPFRNYEEPLQRPWNPDSIPPSLRLHDYQVRLGEDGIWLRNKNQDVWYLPAEQVKTIVRVDHLTQYNKYEWRHSVWLVASREDISSLANQSGQLPEGIEQLPIAQELQVINACYRKTNRFTLKDTDFCSMYHTPQREAELGRMCPQAQWVDLSGLWMKNSG